MKKMYIGSPKEEILEEEAKTRIRSRLAQIDAMEVRMRNAILHGHQALAIKLDERIDQLHDSNGSDQLILNECLEPAG